MEITWIISSLPHSFLGVTFLRKEAHLSQNTTLDILLHFVPLSFGRKKGCKMKGCKMKGFLTINAIKSKWNVGPHTFPMLKIQNFHKVLKSRWTQTTTPLGRTWSSERRHEVPSAFIYTSYLSWKPSCINYSKNPFPFLSLKQKYYQPCKVVLKSGNNL